MLFKLILLIVFLLLYLTHNISFSKFLEHINQCVNKCERVLNSQLYLKLISFLFHIFHSRTICASITSLCLYNIEPLNILSVYLYTLSFQMKYICVYSRRVKIFSPSLLSSLSVVTYYYRYQFYI